MSSFGRKQAPNKTNSFTIWKKCAENLKIVFYKKPWSVSIVLVLLKFHFKDFFYKCQQVCSHAQHISQLLNKSSEENFIF